MKFRFSLTFVMKAIYKLKISIFDWGPFCAQQFCYFLSKAIVFKYNMTIFTRENAIKTKLLNHHFKENQINLDSNGAIYVEKEKTLIIANFEFFKTSISTNKRLANFEKLKKIVQLETCLQEYQPDKLVFIGGLRFHINTALENLHEFKKKFETTQFFHISSKKNAFLADFKHIGINCHQELKVGDFLISPEESKPKMPHFYAAKNAIKVEQHIFPCFCQTDQGFSLPSFAQTQNYDLIQPIDYQAVFGIDQEKVFTYH